MSQLWRDMRKAFMHKAEFDVVIWPIRVIMTHLSQKRCFIEFHLYPTSVSVGYVCRIKIYPHFVYFVSSGQNIDALLKWGNFACRNVLRVGVYLYFVKIRILLSVHPEMRYFCMVREDEDFNRTGRFFLEGLYIGWVFH